MNNHSVSQMRIVLDDLQGPEIAAFLESHLADMRSTSPPESKHALDLNELRKPEICFWSLWQDNQLAGCIALKRLNSDKAEIKSMRTAPEFRNSGVASKLLSHLLAEARVKGYRWLGLETGSMDYFRPARNFYRKFGFRTCSPFASYQPDPNSVFMCRSLPEASAAE